MDEKHLKLAAGSMLHDIGKVIYRSTDGGGNNHSRGGFDYLKDEVGLTDTDILNSVLYHHASLLKQAKIEKDDPAYITYIADNIASGADRRVKDEERAFAGFCKDAPLESIFNILNAGGEKSAVKMVYKPKTLNPEEGINYPQEQAAAYDGTFYHKIKTDITDLLKNMEFTQEYINSLLEVLENLLSYIPSSTNQSEIADISLFDHMKLTAAIASCIYIYLIQSGDRDFRNELFLNADKFYEKKAFLLYSADFSGIQQFIYGHFGTSDILKNLRARSFYLEIMTENLIDETLKELGLTRANLIYVGGGHHYMLLPNTEAVKKALGKISERIAKWLLEVFGTELFYATGYCECSGNDLMNQPQGSYQEIFAGVSEMISANKRKRYTPKDLKLLNSKKTEDHSRECAVCHRSSDRLVLKEGKYICPICSGLAGLSRDVLNKDFFMVSRGQGEDSLELMKDQYLMPVSEKELRYKMKEKNYIRAYSKNRSYVGKGLSKNLFVGDYHFAQTLEELVEDAKGIERLGVLRADIDNLGKAFVSGFDAGHQTLGRAATFSRKLSLFFKFYINDILRNGVFGLETGQNKAVGENRRISIVYSGGDDVFVIGAWKDVLEFSIDLNNSLSRFTQGKLSISAGLGLFDVKYPVSYMAGLSGELEEAAKHIPDGTKNAVTLFDEKNTYHWDILVQKVIGEKFLTIYRFLEDSEDKGKAFLYRLLDLFRHRGEKINLARLAYTLARLEPGEQANEAQKEGYQSFKEHLYDWMRSDEDSRQVVTAIYLYAYLFRERKDEHEL